MGGITTIINKVKYVGIACLSLAILSTLILNIVSSYSSSKVNSSAEPVGTPSILANDSTCNPSNTNAASCISMSISSYPSATGDTNDGNLSLSIPQGGGLVVGRHTVRITTNNVSGFEFYLQSTNPNGSLVYSDKDGNVDEDSVIPTKSDSPINRPTVGLPDKTWAVALPNSETANGVISQGYYQARERYESLVASSTTEEALDYRYGAVPSEKTQIAATTGNWGLWGYRDYYAYYILRVDNPAELLAGTYTAGITYTATTKEVPAPILDSVSPASYELGSGADSKITISGSNLKSAYRVYLTDSNNNEVPNGECTSITTTSDGSSLTCNIPTDQTNPDLKAGDYTIHVITQGGEETIGFSYTEKTIQSSYSVYDPDDNVRVDWDGSMIPVVYDSVSQTWKSLASSDITITGSGWFDYSGKQWANAVTVKDPSKYQNKEITVSESDILAFWVYIPRYAYKVMRKDSTDRYVNAQNFEIQFETTDYGAKHIPKTSCNANATSASAMWRDGNRNNDVLSNIKVGYYQNCAGMNNSYSFGSTGSVISTTSWATHPAFTFGDQELNGLWVGKFELTGSTSQPTVLPNQKHLAQDIVTLYDVAKSMGQEDKNNTGGGNTNVRKNNQNLSVASTRMVNNSDWGAITYLAASKYGAGYDGVQQNTQEQSGLDGDNNSSTGVTGCGPASQNSVGTYSNGGKLGTNLACSSSDSRYAYNGSIGVTASTTGNVYGVYDMSGGAWEYTAANTTTSNEHTTSVSDVQFAVALSEPYANLYRTSDGFDGARPAWWNTRTNYGEDCWNRDVCSWSTCGGQALHEVSNFQTNNNFLYGTWIGNDHYETGDHGPNGNDAAFPSLTEGQPWFIRGECAGWSADTNIYGEPGYVGGEMFSFNYDSGAALDTYGTRVVLMLN